MIGPRKRKVTARDIGAMGGSELGEIFGYKRESLFAKLPNGVARVYDFGEIDNIVGDVVEDDATYALYSAHTLHGLDDKPLSRPGSKLLVVVYNGYFTTKLGSKSKRRVQRALELCDERDLDDVTEKYNSFHSDKWFPD